MGNKELEKFRWERDYVVLERNFNDNTLVLEKRQGGQEFIGREIMSTDRKQSQEIKRLIKAKYHNNNPFLTKLVQVHYNNDEAYCSPEDKIYLVFQKPKQTLRQQILARKFANEPFTEQQADIILESGTKAIRSLREMGHPHNNISTSSIFIDGDRRIMLGDPWITPPIYSVDLNQNVFACPSPEKILLQNDQIMGICLYRSDLFSLGMVVLEALNYQHMDVLYEKGFRKLIQSRVQEKLSKIKNEQLRYKLSVILSHDPKNRDEIYRLYRTSGLSVSEVKNKIVKIGNNGQSKPAGHQRGFSKPSPIAELSKQMVSNVKVNNSQYQQPLQPLIPTITRPTTTYTQSTHQPPIQTHPPTSTQNTPHNNYPAYKLNNQPSHIYPPTYPPTYAQTNYTPPPPANNYQLYRPYTGMTTPTSLVPGGGYGNFKSNLGYNGGNVGDGAVSGTYTVNGTVPVMKENAGGNANGTLVNLGAENKIKVETETKYNFEPVLIKSSDDFVKTSGNIRYLDSNQSKQSIEKTEAPTIAHVGNYGVKPTNYGMVTKTQSYDIPAEQPPTKKPQAQPQAQTDTPAPPAPSTPSTNYFHEQKQTPQRKPTRNYNSTIKQQPDENSYSGSRDGDDEYEYVIEEYEAGRYQGQKKNGMRNGFGKFYYNQGSVYQGHWRDNLMNGKGNLYYSNGKLAYQGDWRMDEFHGFGKVYNEDQLEVKGSYDYADFSNVNDYWASYEGELNSDRRHGKGKIKFSNGQIFVGHFMADAVQGDGKFYTLNGDIIHGLWKNNKLIKRI